MRLYHNTREQDYRSPFGAVRAGTRVALALDVRDAAGATCACRTWMDGRGERLLPMEPQPCGEGVRFRCELPAEEPALLWYYFVLTLPDGGTVRYGAQEGRTGGEGAAYEREPPSFQITVYRERALPDWYKNAVVYQIFPDRFARGADFPERVKSLEAPRGGPGRTLCADWEQPPAYERDERGKIRSWSFYGGTLEGVREKLPYLADLGITAIYLNPIFEAASNHRYDTGDYLRIDPLLGDEDSFTRLAREAQAQGISLILDGVFNHTGCDSRYFNRYGNYEGPGAYESEDSPFREWYRFDDSAAGYRCWWGVSDLPAVQKECESYRAFICRGEESVVRRWLRAGARGWRLDVADELPDDFIAELKSAILAERPEDGLLLGEVWEDASNKVSYGQLRRYLLGEELDCAMNYPLRDALLAFLREELPAEALCETLRTLQENYPPEAFFGALNLLGSHDRPRLLTLLGGAPEEGTLSDRERRAYRLPEGARALGKARAWLAALLQMTLPGVPCVYYGDEAGLEGYSDPYNRAAFPWGREDADLFAVYRNAIALRRLSPLFVEGDFVPFASGERVFGFWRTGAEGRVAVLVNASRTGSTSLTLPLEPGERAAELVSGGALERDGAGVRLSLPPLGSAVVYLTREGLAPPMPRGMGVLCHITSLPEGDLGEGARRFVDLLADAGQTYWQMLPLNPTDEHGSPYAGASAFAGNLALLPESEGELRAQFAAFLPDADFAAFCEAEAGWLLPYTAFVALRRRFEGRPFSEWPEAYRRYRPGLLTPEDAREAEFFAFCQYRFDRTLRALRTYANEKGVRLIGDLPIYVSADSADLWAAPELFDRAHVAGVPPDFFSSEGQRWGNPLYDWTEMERDGYAWWLRRLRRAFSLYDFVRLDHFRGFESYWAIPSGESAAAGFWRSGPGAALFLRARECLGPLPVVAEDLGSLTPAVRGLVARCGFPGTDVLQFYDKDPSLGYTPPAGKVVYTGTHDNQTLRSWCAARYPGRDARETAQALMARAVTSGAEVVILPLQDLLGLTDAARMNTPGTVGQNWLWRADGAALPEAEARLRELAKMFETQRGEGPASTIKK